jgi:hypothetical protein
LDQGGIPEKLKAKPTINQARDDLSRRSLGNTGFLKILDASD